MKMNNAKQNEIHNLHISKSYLPLIDQLWKLQTRLLKIQTNSSIKLKKRPSGYAAVSNGILFSHLKRKNNEDP